MLLKVMFNSILSSAPSLLCFYLSDVKFFSPHLMLLFTLHIGLFHLRFYVYFLSFFLSFLSLHFINCVCRVSCLYELFTSLFVHTYSVTISFPYLFFFFTVYLNFGPLFSLRVKFNCLLSVNFLWVSWFTSPFTEASWRQTYPDGAEFS